MTYLHEAKGPIETLQAWVANVQVPKPVLAAVERLAAMLHEPAPRVVAPLDAAPSTAGNIRLFVEAKAVTKTQGRIAQVVPKAELQAARDNSERLYTSHFATCPNAKAHRKATP